MRELVLSELKAIAAGSDYSSWDVILLSGLSSGVAFGLIGGVAAQSLIEGLKCMVACSVPTATVSAVIILSLRYLSEKADIPD